MNLNDNTYGKVRETVLTAKNKVYATVNFAMVEAYWEIGKEIAEAQGDRADYGKQLMKYLSERLSEEFGQGFTIRNLQAMRQFYLTFPNTHTLCAELSWSHYRLLMRIEEDGRREFYLKECANGNWSVRQLERQINSFFYERLLATQKEHRAEIESEIQTTEPKTDPDYILRDPYILEFLDLKENTKYSESEIEQGLIDKLQGFLLELGKGFSLAARQKRITTDDGEHYYIDLVFYNYILKCFVVVDLKAGKLTYQDIGQIDFYVRLFDDKMKQPDDNPTIGLILCADKGESIVKYSVLSDKENLFASKYKLYLPTEEELKRELERERRLIEQSIADETGDKSDEQ